MSIIHAFSDTHFGNSNIIKYCDRPFNSEADQTEQLISNWNRDVAPEDTVIHCGDFIMGPAMNVDLILPKLNGTIILVRGNHDTDSKLVKYAAMPEKISVTNLHYLQFGGLWFVFCHFPMTDPAFLQMVVKDNSEVVMVHGHVHDQVPFYTEASHSFNVSADMTGFTPVKIKTMYDMVREDFRRKGVWKEKASREV